MLSGLLDGAYKRALAAKSSPCSGGSGFLLLLSKWAFNICPMPYNRNVFCLHLIVINEY